MNIAILGIDLGKTVCSLAGLDTAGAVICASLCESAQNDDRDAGAIAEAATRPTMTFVAIKSEEQLDLQAIHRHRERLVQSRTRLINQARGLLMERGIIPTA